MVDSVLEPEPVLELEPGRRRGFWVGAGFGAGAGLKTNAGAGLKD